MQSLRSYVQYSIAYTYSILTEFYQHQYFKQVVLLSVAIISFIIGRLSHQKKLTLLINMINDADQTKNQISIRLKAITSSIKWTRAQKKILIGLTILTIIGISGYFYLTNQIHAEGYLIGVLIIIVLWILYFIRLRYLQWQKQSLEIKIKRTTMAAETQLKDILQILGKNIQQKFKNMYEAQLQQTWIKEANEECKLYKCFNQKKAYNDLFNLYQDIYNDIKQINLCDVCLYQKNISTIELSLNDFEGRLKMYKKNSQNLDSMPLNKKKQMVNTMLKDFQDMYSKVNRICKKGCCIRQRNLIERAKQKHYDRLKKISSQL